ncbi:MAG TPA: hypothetical protein VMX55_13190 [candidate division Zixibacteria bacterium]|nr:hypothetical protein [candidate division Zixibacteria bacterium]
MWLITDSEFELDDRYALPDFLFECLIYDRAITCEEVKSSVRELLLAIIHNIKQYLNESENYGLVNIKIY